VIEDSTMASKQPAGICVGYNSIHSEAQDLSKADVIINHFNELTLIFEFDSKINNNILKLLNL
jgi:hypothetical protein